MVTVTAGPGLKATQAYPPAFGKAVADMYVRHERNKSYVKAQPLLSSVRAELGRQTTDLDRWQDAEVPEVLKYLGIEF